MLVENIIRFLDGQRARQHVRRPRQLLHRDRLRQGPADRLQLRDRAASPATSPAAVGMPLLKESRMNHLGKLMFQWVYWHALLQGRDIPGIGADMPKAGKHIPNTEGRGNRMSTATYAGVPVEVNDEGFFVDPTSGPATSPSSWPAADGIDELTAQHWQVLDFMRKEYFEKGTGPDGPCARQDLRGQREGALPAVPEGTGEDGCPHRRHPEAERMHLIMSDRTDQARTDQQGLDHRVEGLSRGHLPGADHGQRRPRRGHGGEPVLHVLRPRRHPQEAHRAHQGGHRRQPGDAHPHAHRRPARA